MIEDFLYYRFTSERVPLPQADPEYRKNGPPWHVTNFNIKELENYQKAIELLGDPDFEIQDNATYKDGRPIEDYRAVWSKKPQLTSFSNFFDCLREAQGR